MVNNLDNVASNATNNLDLKLEVFKQINPSPTKRIIKPRKDELKSNRPTTKKEKAAGGIFQHQENKPSTRILPTMRPPPMSKYREFYAMGEEAYKRSNPVGAHTEQSPYREKLPFTEFGSAVLQNLYMST